MTGAFHTLKPSPHLTRTVIIVTAVWTAVMVATVAWVHLDVHRGILELAYGQADQSYEKDLVYRRWAAERGGVYVRVSEETPPNPYLSHIENRDVTTTSGLELTLVNPAYMTRHVQELESKQYGHLGHITSLDPIRQRNAPDEWEAKALREFERGETEVVELTKIGNAEYLRLMRPLITEEHCLMCHASQGYVVGDLRGGISVAVPTMPVWAVMNRQAAVETIAFGLLWVLGLGGIGFGAMRFRERGRAEATLIRHQQVITLNNRIANIFLISPQEDMYADVLDVILKELDSRFGYFGYIDDAGDLVCPSLTRDVWDQCKVADKNIVFPRDSWRGLWGRSLLEKRTLIAGEGLQPPVGHVPIENAMVVPIVHHDTLVGQFAVANKPGGYTETDRERLENVAAQTAPVLAARLEEARQIRAHEELEAQYRQAQKMEAVGQLTGGVAHDFNNLLQIIKLSTALAFGDLETGHPARARLAAIAEAGERGTRLVQQLLLFSRRQIMQPVFLDLNATAADLLEMLSRVIGEHIQLQWHPGKHVGTIHADRSMIEQALMNLCVNARDAMPEGGTLTIETHEAVIDETYCATHSWAVPGRYALLCVSDTGQGIDEDVLDHVFEPFFTTKETGKGTGLGLATVYGIIKQHNGMINVYSEPDQGTVFKLYWPASQTNPEPTEAAPSVPATGGAEMILLVEDEETVRFMTRTILERAGYTVLTAENGAEAVALFEERGEEIDMTIMDVVMPGMGGRETYERMRVLRPGLNALFVSGYSEHNVNTNFVLEKGLTLMQKPFDRDNLLRAVRETLAQPRS